MLTFLQIFAFSQVCVEVGKLISKYHSMQQGPIIHATTIITATANFLFCAML
jgi:hypothetical protein